MGRQEIRVILTNTGTIAEFDVRLVKPLVLSDNWKVAITEMSISSNPINFTSSDFILCNHFTSEGTSEVQFFNFDEEIITSGEDLVSRIKSMGEKTRVFPITIEELRWNSNSQKVEMKLSENSEVRFSSKLAAVLSLDERLETFSGGTKTFQSKYCVDTRLHFWDLFVYSSIISPIIVGEDLLPVFQTLLFEKFDRHQNISKIFNPPIFLKISKTFMPQIDIKICDELGNVLKFPKDTTIICKLLFINENLPGDRN